MSRNPQKPCKLPAILRQNLPLLSGQGGINAVDELLHHVTGLEVVNGYLKIQVHWAGRGQG